MLYTRPGMIPMHPVSAIRHIIRELLLKPSEILHSEGFNNSVQKYKFR